MLPISLFFLIYTNDLAGTTLPPTTLVRYYPTPITPRDVCVVPGVPSSVGCWYVKHLPRPKWFCKSRTCSRNLGNIKALRSRIMPLSLLRGAGFFEIILVQFVTIVLMYLCAKREYINILYNLGARLLASRL